VARRLLAQQPDPPRQVSFSALLEIYGPILGYSAVNILVVGAIAIALTPARGRPIAVALLVFLALATVLMTLALVVPVRAALATGAAVAAMVVRVTGPSNRMTVRVYGREIEAQDTSRSQRRVKVGDRMTVLIDRKRPDKILLML
jgi:O-antigen ligase